MGRSVGPPLYQLLAHSANTSRPRPYARLAEVQSARELGQPLATDGGRSCQKITMAEA
ncbi:hypothetical protein BS50DRAFT_580661 [Corynespora cassiicola Philippines]|uniref:Uncharacterized protein n=1 Tax=Corynespora cassiicola Philippines TaxID=1448308 RepID=A0A2T2MZJ2_CORCC|nr:hypothetical protein BS50DRAFT_580661 [Corynespora cassiicola Philippines]